MKHSILLLPLLALPALPAQAQPELISTINWYGIDAYCTFQREDAVFVADDPNSWNFVFFTQFGADGTLETGSAFVAIRDRLTEFRRTGTVPGKDGETRTYVSYGDDPYEVTVTMSFSGTGYEWTEYKGFLTLKGSSGEETIPVKGTCGV